jgi:hypothetical protein
VQVQAPVPVPVIVAVGLDPAAKAKAKAAMVKVAMAAATDALNAVINNVLQRLNLTKKLSIWLVSPVLWPAVRECVSELALLSVTVTVRLALA